MSMYRQLWLTIILSTLLALAGSLLAATLSARAYLSEQLAHKNADNAAALALSLSQQDPDPALVEVTVAALFDSGHYELIRVTDPLGRILTEKRSPAYGTDVPAWFSKLLPITAEAGQARITKGWQQFGTVELVSHSRFAYRALWQSVIEMTLALVAAGLVGGWLGSLVLRRLKRPLDAVVDQARAITERRFIAIPEPDVPELKSLAAAMNASVTRIKAMFEEEASRLEAVRREANCDPLTGLANRNHFLARLRAHLADEDCPGGCLVLARIAGLAEINRRLGREATDDMLARAGHAVAQAAGDAPDGMGARLNGADFALLLPGCREPRAPAEQLAKAIARALEPFVGEEPAVFVGAGGWRPGLDAGAVLANVDAALAAAETGEAGRIVEAEASASEVVARSGEEWSSIIRSALASRRARIGSFPVVRFDNTLIHRECPLRLVLREGEEPRAAARFLPMAERMKLMPELDLVAVSLGLDLLDANPGGPDVAINLSASSIEEASFRREFLARLRDRPQAARRLWLEMPEAGVLQHLQVFRAFAGMLRECGCRVGIEHFGRQFSRIALIHDLGLDYVKVDAGFIHGLDGNAGNRAFLEGLSAIAHGIGLIVIAEGVATGAEFDVLAELGFDGATGPAVRDER